MGTVSVTKLLTVLSRDLPKNLVSLGNELEKKVLL